MTATAKAPRNTIKRAARAAGPVVDATPKPDAPKVTAKTVFGVIGHMLADVAAAQDAKKDATRVIESAREALPDLCKKAGLSRSILRAYLDAKGSNTLRAAMGWPKASKGPGCNADAVQGKPLHELLRTLAPLCGLSAEVDLADTNRGKKLTRLVAFAFSSLESTTPVSDQTPMTQDEAQAIKTAAFKAAVKVAAPEGARVLPWQARAEVLGQAMAALCKASGAGVTVEAVLDNVLTEFVTALEKTGPLTVSDAKKVQQVFSGLGQAIVDSVRKGAAA